MMATSVDNSDCGQLIQGLLVISCAQNTTNNQFIQNESEEYEPKSLSLGTDTKLDAFELKIDNKYYSTNIFLFDMKDKYLFNEFLSDSVNGVIVYFDSTEDSSFDGLQSCLSYMDQFDNEIKLLVCQTIDDLKREVIQKWCLGNEFELVELCPQTDAIDDDIKDDFEDVDGMTRIFQSIQAYHWPHSHLKDEPQYKPSLQFNDLIDDIPEQSDQKNVESSDQFNDSQQIEDLENFNNLFEKFSEMKVKSSQMNETERKDYAEKVTIAFWKAIGGDINEIEGIDDEVESGQ